MAQEDFNNIITILGGTGLLGKALSKEAKNRGLTTHTIARKNADVNFDATNNNRLFAYLDQTRPKWIINAIAQINIDLCEKNPDNAYLVNVAIVKNLASYCADHNIKLCHISTDHYFSGDKDQLHDEKSSVTLLNEYAKTKYAGECFALANPDSLVLRTNIVGFRHKKEQKTFVEWVIDALASNKPMTMFEDFYTSSIDVISFSKALFDLLFLDISGLINVASRECVNKKQFITALAKHLNFDVSNAKTGSVKSISGTARCESLGLDVSYAESILGYRLPCLDDVIENIAREYKRLI